MLSAYMALYLAMPSSTVMPSTGMGGKIEGVGEGAEGGSEGVAAVSAKDAMVKEVESLQLISIKPLYSQRFLYCIHHVKKDRFDPIPIFACDMSTVGVPNLFYHI
jgi:hypothetical protein